MTNCARRPVYDAPMEVIYLDRLFAVNALIDYLLCLLTGRICGLVLKRPRYLGAALLGAAYAVAAVLPRLALLASGPGKLVCASLMAALAFGGEAKPLRCGAVFLGVSAAFGGAVWALSLAGSRPSLDLRVLALSFALCYGGALITGVSLVSPFWVNLYDFIINGTKKLPHMVRWLKGPGYEGED